MSPADGCSSREVRTDCEGRCVYRCGSCGLHHVSVESGGIYYCPTPGCRGSGNAWWRHRLDSCTLLGKGRHTVAPVEVILCAGQTVLEDLDIATARDRMMLVWAGQVDWASVGATDELPLLAVLGALGVPCD
jgi:hypothetical protein